MKLLDQAWYVQFLVLVFTDTAKLPFKKLHKSAFSLKPIRTT